METSIEFTCLEDGLMTSQTLYNSLKKEGSADPVIKDERDIIMTADLKLVFDECSLDEPRLTFIVENRSFFDWAPRSDGDTDGHYFQLSFNIDKQRAKCLQDFLGNFIASL